MPDRTGSLAGEPVSAVSPGAYVLSDGGGDVRGSAGQGLFYRDVRHLSEFVLEVNGASPVATGSWTRGCEAGFSLEFGEGGLRTIRRRALGGGMVEEILLSNDTREEVEARVVIECAADFKDIFEVRGYYRASERGESSEEAGYGYLRYSYQRRDFRRGTVVRVSGEGIEPIAREGRISFDVRLEPGEERSARVSVTLEEDGEEVRWREHAPLYREAPELETSWAALREGWERSVEDLEALSFEVGEGSVVPAAGAPWYMALFGRDALITAFQTMLLGPEAARNVLRALASYQATEIDDFRDAEPGKIPHELRAGELAFFGEIPHSPYYGTADATPLFLVLLHEVWRWTADEGFIQRMERPARRALGWLLDRAHVSGDGYVYYKTRSEKGLANQGWKDSKGCILFRDGEEAEGPVAPCEIQGYAYDAYVRTAELAEDIWGDGVLARSLRGKAADLRERFNQDFWIEDRGGYYALALDGAGRQVDSLTSNIGHLLWSGIVPAGRARVVAEHLLGELLFSGFGVRTMAEGEAGYDAEGYHTGTVWPYDNSIIAYGLSRYSLHEEANRIVMALLDAAPFFDHRLPEVFAGYSRAQAPEPILYPTSCSPQAWTAGSVPLLLRTVLGLEPDPRERRLLVHPVLPEGVTTVELSGVSIFGERHDLRL
ncbi:MAG: amylo-alpha-1,6-glucosidase [Actinomycetota bacterium]|nr:amylo-alpha-1,6-glucosidase [Actinomycetota bacterium]